MATRNNKKLLLLLAYYELENEEFDFYMKRHTPRRHRFCVRQIYKDRKQKGEYHSLVLQAKQFDSEIFFQMFRMTAAKFEELLRFISPYIEKDCLKRESIKPEERLAVTLRYLTTGDSFKTISSSYRMSDTTVGRIVKETCNCLWNVLKEKDYIKSPKNSDEWKEISKCFEAKWNFPNCLGAIDGKHVIIQCPPRGGSMYFNYKKFRR